MYNSCNKDSYPTELPAITQEGKNTFGFKLDDKIWVPYFPCTGGGPGSSPLEYSFHATDANSSFPLEFGLNAKNNKGADTYLTIRSKNSGAHIRELGNIIDSLYINLDNDESGRYYHKYRGTGFPHYFEITKLDTVNKIVSGVFSFWMYRAAPSGMLIDSIKITDGRFDFQLVQDYSSCDR